MAVSAGAVAPARPWRVRISPAALGADQGGPRLHHGQAMKQFARPPVRMLQAQLHQALRIVTDVRHGCVCGARLCSPTPSQPSVS